MDHDTLCEYLPWDSEFFHRRIARLTSASLNPGVLAQVMQACALQRIDCLYFLAEASDTESIQLAEETGFRFMDIRATLRTWSNGIQEQEHGLGNGCVRLCTPEDVAALRAIARVSHRDSRFYQDANFPASRCDELYETWIEKSCKGYADAVLVADLNGQAVGYTACKILNRNDGQITLLGVLPAARGNGLGQSLVRASLRWFAERGVSSVSVVTQGRNSSAQRIYQRCGLLVYGLQLWYHRWFHTTKERLHPNL